MSWLGGLFGRNKGNAQQEQEEAEKPRRKKREEQARSPQGQRSAPAARQHPDHVQFAEQLKILKAKVANVTEEEFIKRLKIYGGDVNAVLMELELDAGKGNSTDTSRQETPQRATEQKTQPQTVAATDYDEKAMVEQAAAFKVGDAVVSQLGHGHIIEVREDGIIVVTLRGETKGYFSPDALTVTADFVDFETGDIVRSPMGRCKVLRVRGADQMVVLETPTGSEGYFHPSSLQKLDTKFFLADELPNIRSWTAATVREAIQEIYPAVAERLYAKSINGSKLIGLSEDEVLEMTNMGDTFDAGLWDRVAATLGLTCLKDVETFEQGMAKTGAIGPLAGKLAGVQSGPLLRADSALVNLGKKQSDQIGRLEDMQVEVDRLTLTPQLFELRQKQAKTVKKLSGLLASLPNGIQLVREAQIEARKSSFKAMDDEKALEEPSAAEYAKLARRQDAVYQRLLNAGNQIQQLAAQRGVKLPPFNPGPLPPFDASMASMEKLIVRESPQQATEEKSSSAAELYNPAGRHGGKRGGDPLGQAVEAEAKELDLDTLTIVFRLNKEKEDQTVHMPLSVGQKSVTVGGVRKAIQEFLGSRTIEKIGQGSKKKLRTLQDSDELNVGRKRRVEVKVFTTD